MTTTGATPHDAWTGRVRRRSVLPGLLLIVLTVALLGLAATLDAGAQGLLGLLTGVGLVLLFLLPTALLPVVTRRAPGASMLVALLTYTSQVVLVGTAGLALLRSGVMAGRVDGGWLGAGVIALTIVGLGALVWCLLERAPQVQGAAIGNDGRARGE